MDINVVHRYSNLIETLFLITYNALKFKLIGTLQVYVVYARSKAKSRAVRKKTYTRAYKSVEIIFVDTTGPYPEIFIGNRYWIGIVDNDSRYSWCLFTKTKLKLPRKMEELFKNMTSRGNPVKYPRCENTGENQSKLQK